MMYNSDLKLEIRRGGEETAKILTKRLLKANWGTSNFTTVRFWGPSNSTIFKKFRSPPPYSRSLIAIHTMLHISQNFHKKLTF